MKIIRADITHVNLVAPLFDQYRQFYKLASDLSGAGLFIKDRLSKNESVIFLALDDSGGALGFVQLYPSFSSLSMKRLWILNDLFVSPDARKQNIGKLLIEASEDHARQSGAKGLTLMTATDNEPAKNLYLRLGWKQVTQYFTFSKSC